MKAIISSCETYRYTLERNIPSVLRWVKPVLFIMLNPSTADSTIDDPTIRRCMSFSKREGFTKMTVVNLFALRATNPKELLLHSDPIGPDNDQIISDMMAKHDIVIAAWGANSFALKRAEEITKKYGPFHCFGITKNGSPRHPLYVKGDTELEQLLGKGEE